LIENIDEAEENIKFLAKQGINFNDITNQLLQDGIKAFSDSYDSLLNKINDKLSKLKS